jgi:hypothetical protein
MRFFTTRKTPATPEQKEVSPADSPLGTTARNSSVVPIDTAGVPAIPLHLVEPAATWKAILLGSIASIGGFMFGYESGQISGKSFRTLLEVPS